MTLIYFIIVLGVTILIHEFGHFIFAKKAGIYIYEFSIGMGPKLFSFRRKNDETLYAIRLFPIGGYVQMAGEEVEPDKNIPENKRMQSKTWMQRFLTIIAGVLFNFLLAIVLFFIIALIEGAPSKEAYIGLIDKDSNAYKTNLEVGDKILKLNGKNTKSSDMLLLELELEQGKTLNFTVEHKNGKVETIKVKPKESIVDGEKTYKYGFALSNNVEEGIIPSIKYAFNKTGSLLNQMVHIIGYLFTGKLGLESLSGPVGIYNVVGESAKAGLINVVFLIAYLCVNVGFINLLPIPAFDGGRILFMIIEKIKGKSVSIKTENTIHMIGMIFLLALMLIITCNDILRLFG